MTIIQKRINNAKITSIALASILLIGSLSMTVPAFAGMGMPPSPSITLGYNPSPVVDGNMVEMFGIVSVDGVGTSDGNLQIQQGFQPDDVVLFDTPAHDCLAAIQWKDISGNLVHLGGDYSYDGFDTSGLAGQTLVFRTHSSGSGGDFKAGNSDCVPLEITSSECEGDIQIAAIDSSAEPSALQGKFGYTLKVTACTDVENLKIQGGSNGWSDIDTFTRDPEIGTLDIKEKRKNTIYSWKIPALAENDMVTFEVEMTSNIDISCGQTVQINGAWSVAYKLPEDNTKYKTSYTSPLTWTNEC
jgi:hypothetical protein